MDETEALMEESLGKEMHESSEVALRTVSLISTKIS